MPLKTIKKPISSLTRKPVIPVRSKAMLIVAMPRPQRYLSSALVSSPLKKPEHIRYNGGIERYMRGKVPLI